MDNTTIIGLVTVIGALAGTLIPYILKVFKDPNVEFDINYGYVLVLGVIIQAAALIPDSVPGITLKVIVTAFASGYGLQTIINKGVPK